MTAPPPIPDPTHLPPELLRERRFVCWREETRGDRPTKIPAAPWRTGNLSPPPGGATDPANWTDFWTALEWAKKAGMGVGFALGGGWAGIDLDRCIGEDGRVEEWAERLMGMADSYTELSPSRRGVHILIRAPEQDPVLAHDEGVEAYFRDRFFTITGWRWRDSPQEVREAPRLVSFLRSHFGEKAPAIREEGKGIPILKVLESFGVRLPRRGKQLQGPHPVHGSGTGMNFTVSPEKNAWYCFRHEAGGGPFTLIGILAGIISCEDVKKLTQEQISAIAEEARKRGLLEEEGEKKKGREASYELLQELADKRVKELFRDEEGEVCAVVEEGGHLEVWPVRSLDPLLNVWFYEEFGRGVRQEVRRDVMATLEARGLKGGAERVLHLLCSLEENPKPKIVADLYTPDWKGVVITPERMEVSPLPPAFRRARHLGPLWEPEIPFGGEPGVVILDFLRRIIPEPEDPRAYDLLAPAMPVLLLPVPRSVLVFLGGHGSAKSLAQRMLARALLRKQAPRPRSLDQEDMSLVARENPVLLLDNVNRITEELATFLCVCVTGEKVGGRERYTDKGTVYYGYRRAVFLNGISPNIHSFPDLADRCLVVKLRRIPEEKRKPEGELERELEPLLPKVFSACLESLRRALAELPRAREDLRGKLPRMADFAEWGEAAARGMGYPPMAWFGLYMGWVGEQLKETVESSTLGRTLLKLAEELKADAGDGKLPAVTLEDIDRKVEGERAPVRGILGGKPTWAGTPANLLGDLRSRLETGLEEAENEGFPRTPQRLGVQLRGLQSSLQDLGVEVSFRKSGGPAGLRLVLVQCRSSDNRTFRTTPHISIPLYPVLGALNAGEGEGEGEKREMSEGETNREQMSEPSERPRPDTGESTQDKDKEEDIGKPGVEYTEILLLGDMEYVVVGEDGKTYGPFRRGERVRVPKGLAGVLAAQGVAAEVKDEAGQVR